MDEFIEQLQRTATSTPVIVIYCCMVLFCVINILISSRALKRSNQKPNYMTEELAEKQLTYGEKAVGLSFNPSNNPDVDSIKRYYANIIDKLKDLRNVAESGEKARLCSVAITEAQTAQMWAIKAITWQD